MAQVTFAKAFRRHVECPDEQVDAATLGGALDEYFARHPQVRGYVLDDEGAIRRHVTVFVGADQVGHSSGLDVPISPDGTVYLFQALSGG